jgi:hypothetical protein
MTKLPTLSLLLSTNILTVHGWIPRISTSLRYYGNQNDNGRARGHETQQQQRVLHSKKFDDDGGFDDASDGDYDFDEDHHFILFGDGSIHKAPAFISRLEAIYGMDTQVDLTSENDVDNIGTASTVTTTAKEPLWQDKGERTKIGDWMDMTEGPCLGDCCGDECDEVRLTSCRVVSEITACFARCFCCPLSLLMFISFMSYIRVSTAM